MSRTEEGFTLVEVLVALGVLGLAVLALLRLGSAHGNTIAASERIVLAEIVADNALAEAITSDTPPALGEDRQTLSNMGERWLVESDVAVSAEPDVLIVEIFVTGPDARRLGPWRGYRWVG
ncbi:MAG: type II secretion system minor pseudopilin GspI [Pacificimonas sp.]